jgi:hypothetical protein
VSIDNSCTISAAESGIGDFSTSNGVRGTQLKNRASGVISGGENGVVALKMDIVNSGTIAGATVGIAGNATGGNGVTVENQEGATISATGSEGFAINLSGDVNEITNAGLIDGADDGVLMASDSTLTNNATGTIDGKGGVGVVMLNGGDVTNEADSDTGAEGLIKGATQAVRLNESGKVLISGMIEGGEDGVLLVEGGQVTNSGTIDGEDFGLRALSGGTATVTNETDGKIKSDSGTGIQIVNCSIDNSGEISGSALAVDIDGATTVTNFQGGRISATGQAINAITSDALIINEGTIETSFTGTSAPVAPPPSSTIGLGKSGTPGSSKAKAVSLSRQAPCVASPTKTSQAC